MKKYIFIIFCLFILSSCVFSPDHTGSSQDSSPGMYQRSITDEEKTKLAKDRIKQIDTIRKGDYFSLKNNPDEALVYYMQALEKLPDDILIQKKIGNIYFQKKDWKNAYDFYIKVPIAELKENERSQMLSALFFDESQLDRMGELARMPTWTGEKDYFQIIDVCYTGIHNCIVSIQSYSGVSQDVQSLKETIRDAEKVSPDYQYRNFAVAARLYDFWAYRAAEKICREILENRPDYAWVLKLHGFALAELGRSNEAKNLLLVYVEQHPDDVETTIKLGDIFYMLGEYATANLYLNNAITAWYPQKTDIERKLAYNYSLLGDTVGMMKVLGYLLQEHDATEDDAAVAISLALKSGENLRAYVWATESLKKHPNSSIIAGLTLTSMRLMGKKPEALKMLSELPQSSQSSPIILLEQGILLYEKQDLTGALQSFEKVLSIDEGADFSEEAKNYITVIRSDMNPAPTEKQESKDGWWF